VLEAAGILPTERYVNYAAYDGWEDSTETYTFPRERHFSYRSVKFAENTLSRL